MRQLAAVLIFISMSWAGASEAGTRDRIRHDGVLRCGSAIRPGLAFPAVDHSWHGLHVDLCHAIAAAVLGEGARIEFNGYVLRKDYDRIRAGDDDVAFLTTSEMFANELFGAVLPGPTVFEQSTSIMIADGNPARHVADLGGTMVCVEPGTAAERNLQEYASAHGWAVKLSPWMEVEEMMDAFNAGRCPAVVGEVTALAALRLGSEQLGRRARILPEPLALTPVMAATSLADPSWAPVVTWTIDTVLLASNPATHADAQTLRIAGSWLGLERDWQSRAIAAAGPYAAMVRRSLGAESPLDLPSGPNASWRDGGLIVPPAVE